MSDLTQSDCRIHPTLWGVTVPAVQHGRPDHHPELPGPHRPQPAGDLNVRSQQRSARTDCRLASILLAVVSLLAGGSAAANGPQVGFQAGAIFPIGSKTIRLLSERVSIHLGEPLDRGRAECYYELVNLVDSTQAFQMSFVPYGYFSGDSTDQSRFTVKCEGKKVPLHYATIDRRAWLPYTTDPPGSLPVWDLVIGPTDTLHLNMTYPVYWTGDNGDGWWRSLYNTRPASLWAGSIGHAKVEFEFDQFTGTLLRDGCPAGACETRFSPSGYAWSGWRLVWEFDEWEPREDIAVEVKIDER
jgi:hypothetical protein